jgi:hypothetical protein
VLSWWYVDTKKKIDHSGRTFFFRSNFFLPYVSVLPFGRSVLARLWIISFFSLLMCYLCQENAVRSVHRLCQTLLFLSDLPVKKTSPNYQDDVRGAHHRRSDRLHAAAQDRAPRRPEFENVTAMRNTYGDHPHPVDASTFATVPRSLEKKRRRLDVRRCAEAPCHNGSSQLNFPFDVAPRERPAGG